MTTELSVQNQNNNHGKRSPFQSVKFQYIAVIIGKYSIFGVIYVFVVRRGEVFFWSFCIYLSEFVNHECWNGGKSVFIYVLFLKQKFSWERQILDLKCGSYFHGQCKAFDFFVALN